MREIKIKVYDPKNKKLIIPSEDADDVDLTYADDKWYITGDASLKTLGYVKCLCINRKDKNGEDIYQDDIVFDEDGRIKIVVYCETCCTYELAFYEKGKWGSLNDSEGINWECLKVIGNINMNPEIMEKVGNN